MVVWWFACTILLVFTLVGIEILLEWLGPTIGISVFSLRYWIILIATAVALLCVGSILASHFYEVRLEWSAIDLPLSKNGFVEVVALSQVLIVACFLGGRVAWRKA